MRVQTDSEKEKKMLTNFLLFNGEETKRIELKIQLTRKSFNVLLHLKKNLNTYSPFGLCSPLGISKMEKSNFTRSRF